MLKSKPSINLMFLGGVGDDVTGSSTLVAIDLENERRYGLIDVGGYQGEGNRNYFFPVDATKIDFVIITHAHYDHIGLLPKLYKDGFRGHVYISEQAKYHGNLILQDTAVINIENSECSLYGVKKLNKARESFENKKKKATTCRDIRNLDSAISQLDDIIQSPLYTGEHVKELLNYYEIVKPYSLFTIYEEKVFARLIPTTHQNGAVQVEFYYKDEDEQIGILFTGDIGSDNSLLYEKRMDFVNYDIDYAVLESLHGTAVPEETLEDSIRRLEEIIRAGMKKNKRVILAGFSLDRDAMLVYLINKMFAKGVKFDAYLDAPLAYSQLMGYTSFYKREDEVRRISKDEESLKYIYFKDLGRDPFNLSKIKAITKYKYHLELLNEGSGKREVIITASANGSGGRIVDFFDKYIQDSDTIFVFCGWVYPGSPSQILHSTPSGEIVDFGYRRFKKNCETYQLHGLSSHGYLPEIFSKLYSYPKVKEVILNHGETSSKEDVRYAIKKEFDIPSHIPNLYDAYEVSKDSIRILENGEALKIFSEVILPFNMESVLAEIAENVEEKIEE